MDSQELQQRRVRYAIKTGLAGAAAMYTVMVMELQYAFTAVTGVHMLMTLHKDQSLNHALYRIAGPVVTLLVGLVLVPLFWAMPGLALLLATLYILIMARGYTQQSHSYARVWAILSMLFLLYIAGTQTEHVTTFVKNWTAALIVGVIYTYIAVMLIWPSIGAQLRIESFDFGDPDDTHWLVRSLRITITAMASLLLAMSMELEGGLSLTVSAIICSLTDDGRATVSKAMHRAVGVIFGAAYGLLCLLLLHQFGHLTVLLVMVGIGLGIFCYFGLSYPQWRYPFAQSGLVLSLITMPMTAPIGDFKQAPLRLEGLILGVLVAFTVWAVMDVFANQRWSTSPLKQNPELSHD